MTKIWIYGDSFVDSCYPDSIHNKYSWTELLSKTYNVINSGMTGAGQDSQFEKLLSHVTKNDTSNDILIFVAPARERFNFSFLKSEGHQHSLHFLENPNNTYTKEQIEFVKRFYYYYVTEANLIVHATKNVLSVSSLSNKFKKTLYWPTGKVDYEELYKELYNHDNFVFMEPDLFQISIAENTWKPGDGKDNRACHLSIENNKIMASMIIDWIENNTPINTSRFISC